MVLIGLDHRHRAQDGRTEENTSGGSAAHAGSTAAATKHTTRQRSSRRLHTTAQEARGAVLLDGGVKVRLALEERALRETESVRRVRLEARECREDVARACLAKLGGGSRGLEEEEEDVGALECLRVGHDRQRGLVTFQVDSSEGRVEAGDGGDTGRGSLSNAVVAAVVLGADGVGEGDKRVEDVVVAHDVRVDARCELDRAV